MNESVHLQPESKDVGHVVMDKVKSEEASVLELDSQIKRKDPVASQGDLQERDNPSRLIIILGAVVSSISAIFAISLFSVKNRQPRRGKVREYNWSWRQIFLERNKKFRNEEFKDGKNQDFMNEAVKKIRLQESAIVFKGDFAIAIDYSVANASLFDFNDHQWMCLQLNNFAELDEICEWVAEARRISSEQNLFWFKQVVFANYDNFTDRQILTAQAYLMKAGAALFEFPETASSFEEAVRLFDAEMQKADTQARNSHAERRRFLEEAVLA